MKIEYDFKVISDTGRIVESAGGKIVYELFLWELFLSLAKLIIKAHNQKY
jgi:hypothetical protein